MINTTGYKYVIYEHSTSDGRVYIGKTASQDIQNRWRSGLGYKQQPDFYEVIMEEGWRAMGHRIIDACDDCEEAKLREKYWACHRKLEGFIMFNCDNEDLALNRFVWDTDEDKYYATMNSAGNAIGVAKGAINFSMSEASKHKRCLGHHYEFVEFYSVEALEDTIKLTSNIQPFEAELAKRAEVPYIRLDTKQFFVNRTELAKSIGCAAQALSQCERKNTNLTKGCKGVPFRRATTDEIKVRAFIA